MDDAGRVSLAVALFERGFTACRVEAATQRASTLEGALAWLSGETAPRRKRTSEAPAKATSAAERRKGAAGRASSASDRRSLPATPHRRRRSSSSEAPMAIQLNRDAETCVICCCEAPPSRAVRLGCRHGWYCASCMQRHAEARLGNGAADVPCPECREPIQDYNLRKLLTPEIIDRLHDRSFKQAVACSANLYTCPTPNCDMCVELEDGEDPHLRQCPKCKKSSCLRCSVTPYHHGLTCSCYQEQRRRNATTQEREEESFRRWMQRTGTKQCPQCKIPVSKEDLESQSTQRKECHKMVCRQCKTRFCFKCLAVLTDSYTCGCSIDAHGFVDPNTGRRLEHLRASVRQARAKPAAAGRKAAAAAPQRGTARSSRTVASPAVGRSAAAKKAQASSRASAAAAKRRK
eukprot:TRINITY_DN47790_c0_g1_i1.p1 TRINITY_DN47790_c0_g1~~TRINITY_DN47790_c0_g1_i1.p1  ORF type:complete len:456 (-),score=65.84 TRINITY_DN47790_c0_g1_i1:53-1267(-)